MDARALKAKLSHILWLGGGADAGKTTTAETIAERYSFAYYSFDLHERSYIDRMSAAGFYAGRKPPHEMTPDELWVDREPEEMAVGIIREWSRRAQCAIEDLLAMPQDVTLVAEGPGFFPEVINPLLTSKHQAVWIVPAAPFKRKIAIQRGKPGVRQRTRDPARATENLIERDLLVAEHVKRQAKIHQLKLLEVDGSQPVDETIRVVEEYFAAYLPFKKREGLDVDD